MNNLPTIFNYQEHEVRTVFIDGEIWFVLVDVCKVLEIVDHKTAANRLDDDEKGVHTVHTLGGDQVMLCVNESGLYHLIFTSRKSEAKAFRQWVTTEVLPSIRKTGIYDPSGQLAQLQERLSDLETETREELELLNYRYGDLVKELRDIRMDDGDRVVMVLALQHMVHAVHAFKRTVNEMETHWKGKKAAATVQHLNHVQTKVNQIAPVVQRMEPKVDYQNSLYEEFLHTYRHGFNLLAAIDKARAELLQLSSDQQQEQLPPEQQKDE